MKVLIFNTAIVLCLFSALPALADPQPVSLDDAPAATADPAAKPNVSQYSHCDIVTRRKVLTTALVDPLPDTLVCDDHEIAKGNFSVDWAAWLTSDGNHFVEGQGDTRVDTVVGRGMRVSKTVVEIRSFQVPTAKPNG